MIKYIKIGFQRGRKAVRVHDKFESEQFIPNEFTRGRQPFYVHENSKSEGFSSENSLSASNIRDIHEKVKHSNNRYASFSPNIPIEKQLKQLGISKKGLDASKI